MKSAFLDTIELVATAAVLSNNGKRCLEAVEIFHGGFRSLCVLAEFDEFGLEVSHIFPDFRRRCGLTAGNGGSVRNRNPLSNLFGRLDAALPELKSRAVLWLSEADADNLAFSRGSQDTTFATGVSDEHGVIPRFGEGLVNVPVTASTLRLVFSALGLVTGGQTVEKINYRLDGKLSGPGWGSTHFQSTGELKLPNMPSQ